MSNHIDHIEITNFKSIRHAKIEGCKRINVFIGYPNVGKSAILEAISALAYLQEDFKDDFSKLCRLNYSYELFYDAAVKNPIEIRIDQFTTASFEYSSEINIDFKIKTSAGLTGGMERNIKTINFRKGQMTSCNSGYNTLDKSQVKVKKYTFTNKYNEQKTTGLNLEFPFGENLVDVVHLNKELRKTVAELFSRYNLKLIIDPSTNSIKGIKESENETILIPYSQMADTLQRLIFHKAAIMSNENTVLLFEEPEAHMFPPYIRRFTEDIIFNKSNNNQYFISTHSPFVIEDLIEDVRDDLSIYLVGLKNGETIIKRLTDDELEKVHKLHVDLFFNIESYLD